MSDRSNFLYIHVHVLQRVRGYYRNALYKLLTYLLKPNKNTLLLNNNGLR